MNLVLAVGSAWALLALPVAVFVGRGIRFADQPAPAPSWTDDVEQYLRGQASAHPS